MSVNLFFEDLKEIDYKKAWDYQETLHKALIDKKLNKTNNSDAKNAVLFCEHPHVYTLGKSGDQNNLLISEQFLKSVNASFYKINRGGDITYHGPGQLTGYPILDLELFKMSVKQYVYTLEQVIIDSIAEFGLQGSRLEGATGVWLDVDKPNGSRKICAIGVKISRYVTLHGFGLNINTNLDYFSYINPCGFIDKGVTSLQKETGNAISMNDVKQTVRKNFEKLF